MEVLIKGVLMEVHSSEYDYEGKKGISRKLYIYDGGIVYKVSVDEVSANYYRDFVGSPVEVRCSLFCKGQYNLKLLVDKVEVDG